MLDFSFAQVGNAVNKKLTIEDLTKYVLANNPDLNAARYIIKEAESRLVQSGLWPNPRIEFEGSSDKFNKQEGEQEKIVAFSQAFPISGRLSQAKKIARVEVAMAMEEFREKQRHLIAEVHVLYWKIAVMKSKIAAYEDSLVVLEKSLKLSRKRLAQAEISQTDFNSESLEFKKLVLEKAILVSELKIAQSLLQRLGLDGSHTIEAFDFSLDRPFQSYRTDYNLEATLESRPDYRLLALEVGRAGAELALAKSTRWDDWELGLEYRREQQVLSQAINQESTDFVGLRLAVPLPFWNRNQGIIEEHKYKQQRQELLLMAQRSNIEIALKASCAKIKDLSDVLSNFQSSSIKLAKENVVLLRKSYADGIVSITAVLQAQQQVLALQNLYFDSLESLLLARVDFDLQQASHPLLPEIYGAD